MTPVSEPGDASPYSVEIDHAARVIVFRGRGSATTADTLRLIADNQATFRDHAGYDMLYDSIGLKIDSSPADMVRVATALFSGEGAGLRKVALVVPQRRAELAMMFAALAHPHGIPTGVFPDTEEALAWLAGA